jgi:glycosyltransferase involved in cell wall biosynthesis
MTSAAPQIVSGSRTAQQCRVAWLPAHPAEGWVSMNRYWFSLAQAAEQHRDTLAMETPLDAESLVSRRRGRVARAWTRYIAYPHAVRTRVTAPVAHVLDHSYAHLLDHLPRRTRTVVTVHDLIPLVDPSGLTVAQVNRFRKTVWKLREADCLVAVSDYTRRTACELLDIKPGRVAVVHSGVDETFFQTVTTLPPRVQALPRRRYVLSVGSDLPRKNLRTLPTVMRALAREVPDVCLVRVGALMSDSLAAECRAALGQGCFVELGGVSDDDLRALYQQAGAFFMPSNFEGWGLPVAEALASGCPVVCSNVSSLPEAGGGAALMAAPDDAETFAQHLARVMEDERFREELIAEGRNVSAARTWSRTMEQLIGIYRSLA